jgi:hypothetical protein
LCFSATHRLKWQAELAEGVTSKAVIQDAI